MDYSTATECIKLHYTTQYDLLIKNLCQDAIITLGNLCKEHIQRPMSNETIKRLSVMEPDRQCGWIANPLIQSIIDSYVMKFTSGSTGATTTLTPTQTPTPAPNSQSTVPSNVKPNFTPKPEPDDDVEPWDIFADSKSTIKAKPEPEPVDDVTPFDLFA